MSSFDKFQQSEYQHIADAHFKAIESISSFFRYYLVVMALPVPVGAAIFGLSAQALSASGFVPALFYFLGVFLFAVAIAGFCILVQIINLKMDVVLYSRVVNSIRKYFYDRHDRDHANKLLMRQLPQSAYFPSYWDLPFAFITGAFALFDTLYAAMGVHILVLSVLIAPKTIYDIGFGHYHWPQFATIGFASAFVFVGHFVTYFWASRYRENAYLRGRAIGIDIDGVLNKHREQFCRILLRKTSKHLDPAAINILPVHDIEGLSVTRDDERAVFNDPEYWVTMPAMVDAADAIKSMRNSLLLPVHIFTHRPWPDTSAVSSSDKARWRAAAQAMAELAGAGHLSRAWVWVVTRINFRRSMRYITAYWLKKAGIQFNHLLVERGNENLSYARGRYENRFSYARRRKIRFFVEDDWIKAVKLAYICDIVFLIDHPYNKVKWPGSTRHHDELTIGELPANIIRVTSWREIKKLITQIV